MWIVISRIVVMPGSLLGRSEVELELSACIMLIDKLLFISKVVKRRLK